VNCLDHGNSWRVLDNYGYEAAREPMDERRRMLAYAAAGSVHHTLTIAQLARVERMIRELDPDDLVVLAKLEERPMPGPRSVQSVRGHTPAVGGRQTNVRTSRIAMSELETQIQARIRTFVDEFPPCFERWPLRLLRTHWEPARVYREGGGAEEAPFRRSVRHFGEKERSAIPKRSPCSPQRWGTLSPRTPASALKRLRKVWASRRKS
jgi:hypothetical protein